MRTRLDVRPGLARTGLLIGLSLAALAACSGHHLAEYDFADRTLAVVYFNAPAPEVHTGGYDVDGDNPLEVVVSASGRVAREMEARRARARMDSAVARVDLAGRLADRTAERAGRYLGTRPVEDASEADYLLEVDIRRMGLEARRGGAYTFVQGEVVLLDGRTGREIWDAGVNGHDRVTPGMWDAPGVLGDVVTAGALSGLSVDEFERLLVGLTDYVADRVGRELRGDLRRARD